MKKNFAILPILAGFFVMGFCDIISTVLNQVKAECQLSDVTAGFLPSMIFIWFFLISIPTGILCGKIGRKNTVLLSLAVTLFAMLLPMAASAERFWIYFAEDGKTLKGASEYHVIIPVEKRPAILQVSSDGGGLVINAELDQDDHTLIFH